MKLAPKEQTLKEALYRQLYRHNLAPESAKAVGTLRAHIHDLLDPKLSTIAARHKMDTILLCASTSMAKGRPRDLVELADLLRRGVGEPRLRALGLTADVAVLGQLLNEIREHTFPGILRGETAELETSLRNMIAGKAPLGVVRDYHGSAEDVVYSLLWRYMTNGTPEYAARKMRALLGDYLVEVDTYTLGYTPAALQSLAVQRLEEEVHAVVDSRRIVRHRDLVTQITKEQIKDIDYSFEGIIIIKAGHGTGKTQIFGVMARKGKHYVVVLTPRRSLTDMAGEIYEIENDKRYKIGEIRQDEDGDLSVVTTSSSVSHPALKDVMEQTQVLMIDEITAVFDALAEPTLHRIAQQSYTTYRKLLQTAPQVFGADADIGDEEVDLLLELSGGRPIRIYEIVEDFSDLFFQEIQLSDLREGTVPLEVALGVWKDFPLPTPVIFFTDSKLMASVTLPRMLGVDPDSNEVLILHADNKDSKKAKEFFADPTGTIERRKYKYVFCSPVVETGVSLQTDHFAAVVGVFNGTISSASMLQQLRRVRSARYFLVARNGSAHGRHGSTEGRLKAAQDVATLGTEMEKQGKSKTTASKVTDYDLFEIRRKSSQALRGRLGVTGLFEIAKASGAHVTPLTFERRERIGAEEVTEREKEWQRREREIRQAEKAELVAEICSEDTPDLPHEEARRLPNTPEYRAIKERARIRHELGYPVDQPLTEEVVSLVGWFPAGALSAFAVWSRGDFDWRDAGRRSRTMTSTVSSVDRTEMAVAMFTQAIEHIGLKMTVKGHGGGLRRWISGKASKTKIEEFMQWLVNEDLLRTFAELNLTSMQTDGLKRPCFPPKFTPGRFISKLFRRLGLKVYRSDTKGDEMCWRVDEEHLSKMSEIGTLRREVSKLSEEYLGLTKIGVAEPPPPGPEADPEEDVEESQIGEPRMNGRRIRTTRSRVGDLLAGYPGWNRTKRGNLAIRIMEESDGLLILSHQVMKEYGIKDVKARKRWKSAVLDSAPEHLIVVEGRQRGNKSFPTVILNPATARMNGEPRELFDAVRTQMQAMGLKTDHLLAPNEDDLKAHKDSLEATLKELLTRGRVRGAKDDPVKDWIRNEPTHEAL